MSAASAPRVIAAALVALPVVAACSPASTSIPAPAPAASTTLVVRLGTDTLAVEQYTRTATHMEGTLVTRRPAVRVSRYSVDLGRNNAPTRADLSVRDATGAPVAGGMQSLSVRFARDSVAFVGHRSAGDTSRALPLRGVVLPSLPLSYGLYELALARLSGVARDSIEFADVPLSFDTRQATPRAVRVVSRDSVRIALDGGPLYVRHDGRGGIVAADGAGTTLEVQVARADSLDVDAIARAWAAHDEGRTPAAK